MASVLGTATTRRTKTCLLHKCNLNHNQLQFYLHILCEKGLLRADIHKARSNPGRVFLTTEKGRAFLKAYGDLRNTIEKTSISP